MTISKEAIGEIVVQILQEMIGDKSVQITADAKPIGAYGLDSHDGIEFAAYVSEKLPYEIPVALNPFVDANGTIPEQRTVGEIIDLLASLATQAKG